MNEILGTRKVKIFQEWMFRKSFASFSLVISTWSTTLFLFLVFFVFELCCKNSGWCLICAHKFQNNAWYVRSNQQLNHQILLVYVPFWYSPTKCFARISQIWCSVTKKNRQRYIHQLLKFPYSKNLIFLQQLWYFELSPPEKLFVYAL